MRYKIIIEYVGTGFVGWQRQNSGLSVQELLEDVITKVANFEYQNSIMQVPLTAAGRTDTGVHAFGQVAHFDLPTETAVPKFVASVNHFLRPHLVKILEMQLICDDFHARYSAIRRHYLYRIIARKAELAIDYNRACRIDNPLDVHAILEAASHLKGTHDFSSFRASSCQANSPIRTIDNIMVSERDYLGGGQEINIHISAQSFLHHMVRNIVGSLILVGSKKWTIDDFVRIFKAADRTLAGATAPAEGLFFYKVDYN